MWGLLLGDMAIPFLQDGSQCRYCKKPDPRKTKKAPVDFLIDGNWISKMENIYRVGILTDTPCLLGCSAQGLGITLTIFTRK
jgi:hypothetical protein